MAFASKCDHGKGVPNKSEDERQELEKFIGLKDAGQIRWAVEIHTN